jgi:hypothetical protein
MWPSNNVKKDDDFGFYGDAMQKSRKASSESDGFGNFDEPQPTIDPVTKPEDNAFGNFEDQDEGFGDFDGQVGDFGDFGEAENKENEPAFGDFEDAPA